MYRPRGKLAAIRERGMEVSELKIESRQEGEHRVMALAGRFTPNACDLFREVAEAEVGKDASHLIVELTDLEHIASSGIGNLIWLERDCRNAERKMLVVNDNPTIQRVLELTGLDQHFTMARTVEEALALP